MQTLNLGRSAVVDIGSNSVRMVIFEHGDRSLEPVFNEKAMSGLGRDLLATRRLDPEGRVSALRILTRFNRIASDLNVSQLSAVATAAVRAAEDGGDFVEAAEQALAWPIKVISGEEEARLSGLGVICGIPEADGVIGDLGGGSLEIAEVAQGAVSGQVSLPLGPLALGEIVGKRGEAKRVQAVLEGTPEGLAAGRTLYAVGGAWRGLAREYFNQARYPIRIIQQFALPADAALTFARKVGRVRQTDVARLKGVSGRRRSNAPFAARLLARLIERLQPERLVFSGYGLREGLVYDGMTDDLKASDPLIDHCRRVGRVGARIPFDGDRMAEWALAAFETPPAAIRLVRAAAWLSDLAGADHPDYRGHHAADRALHMPTAAIEHTERVFLAAATYARYHGFGMESALGKAATLIDEDARQKATALGMAFRLAHAIEPGDGAILVDSLRDRFRLEREGDTLLLQADGVDPEILGETARRRFTSLARALGVAGAVVARQSAAA